MCTHLTYSASTNAMFIESRLFEKLRLGYLPDDDFQELQKTLLNQPKSQFKKIYGGMEK